MKKKFKVNKSLKEYVRNILDRENIRHFFRAEGEQLYCITSISGEKFHKIIQRAYCEKKSEETGLLYLTIRESKDVRESTRLMRMFNKTGFVIIGKQNK